MSQTISFGTSTEFLGRNGIAAMSGIHVHREGGNVYIAPVTSRTRIGRAYLLIPVKVAPDVAQAILRVSGTRLDRAA